MTDSTLRPKTAPRNDMTAEEARSRFYYDADSGLLYWRPVVPSDRYKMAWNSRCAWRAAGDMMWTGYMRVRVNGRAYLAHRLAWLMTHGEWPNGEIDHINMKRSDNRIINLRAASSFENKFNSGPKPSNRCGLRGVFWNKVQRKWNARIMVGGKYTYLGSFDRPEDARAAYLRAATSVAGEFVRL